MLRLAMANREESFERLQAPLEARGIAIEHTPCRERTIDLQRPPWTAEQFDAGFVFPGRLYEGGVLDAALDVPWVNGREAVLTSRNKAGVLTALEAAGIPVPETIAVSNPVDQQALAAAYDALEAPVIVKPNSTTRGIGVTRVDDPDSFAGVTDYLELVHDYQAVGDKSFLVQEYLSDARDYRVMVLDGEYAGAVERELSAGERSSGHWLHNVHRGATATGVELPEELRELAERTAQVLDIPVLGVDLLVTADRAVVNETNARPTIDSEPKYQEGFFDRLAAIIELTASSP